MVDPSTPASVKARVADSILNHAVKATETEAVQARSQTAENDMGSPARRRRIEQGTVLGIAQDMVFCHRERVGNSLDVTAAEPRHQAPDSLQEFFQDRCLITAEGDVDSWKNEGCWVPVADLYPTYAAWAAATGDKQPFRKKTFEQRLHELGREKGRVRPDGRRATKQVWVWLGIRFSTAAEDQRVPCAKSAPCDNVLVGFLSHAVTPSRRMEIEAGQRSRKEGVPNSQIGTSGRQPASD
jgi:hypothetical protein